MTILNYRGIPVQKKQNKSVCNDKYIIFVIVIQLFLLLRFWFEQRNI